MGHEVTHTTFDVRYICEMADIKYMDGIPEYGVDTISRLLKIIGLFYKRAL